MDFLVLVIFKGENPIKEGTVYIKTHSMGRTKYDTSAKTGELDGSTTATRHDLPLKLLCQSITHKLCYKLNYDYGKRKATKCR